MLVPIEDIKIPPRFRKDLGNLDSLTNSMRKVGLLHPVVLTVSLVLVCGARRVEVGKRLGWTHMEAHVIDFSNISASEAEAAENNIRKSFTTEERAEIYERFREEEGTKAKERQRKGKAEPSLNFNKGRSMELIAKRLDISYGKLIEILKIKSAAKADPLNCGPIWEKVAKDKVRVHKGYTRVQRLLKIQEARKQAHENSIKWDCNSNTSSSSNFEVKLGPMQKRGLEIADNSIPLIFTDPPYEKESLPLCDDLARLALRVLKPGGSLVIITPGCPKSFLYYINTITKCGLKFNGYVAMVHTGKSKRLDCNGTIAKHKGMLWFFKAGPENSRPTQYHDIPNVVKSEPPSKELHDWEQGTPEVEHFIRGLTVEEDWVLDPFAGRSTTGAASLLNGRKFIGIEIDPFHHSDSVNRLKELECQLATGIRDELKSFEQLTRKLERRIENISKELAEEYVPVLCEAIKREKPELDLAGIRLSVIHSIQRIYPLMEASFKQSLEHLRLV